MAKKILPPSPATGSTALDAEIAELSERLARLKAQARGNAARHRVRDRLTDRKIAVLKIPGFYADGGNLYLDFKDPPSKNWVVRYTRRNRAHDHGLGAYPEVSLAAARLKRDAVLAGLRDSSRIATTACIHQCVTARKRSDKSSATTRWRPESAASTVVTHACLQNTARQS